ncbi:MAG: MFS transporter [Hyphomonadaceae bacterium]
MKLRDLSAKAASWLAQWRRLTFAPLDAPLFRTLWVSAFFFNFGAVIQSVGAAWMMTTLHASEFIVSLVQTASLAPFLLLSLPAGALADSADRRTILLIAQIGGGMTAVALATLTYLNAMTPAVLLAATAVIGAMTAIQQPAWHASVGDLVPRERLPAAIGLNSLAFNLARSTGPALGGVVVAISGPFLAFALNAAAALGTATVMAANRLPQTPRTAPTEPLHAAISTGLRYVVMAPALLLTLVRSALVGMGGGAIWALTPVIAQQRLGGGPIDYGLLLTGFGIGAVFGALMSNMLQVRLGVQRHIQIAIASIAIATAGIAFSPFTLLSALFMMAGGFGWNAAMTTLTSAVQFGSPKWVVGRAVALSRLATFGALAFGSAACGLLAEATDVSMACVGAALFLAGSLLIPGLERLPDRTSPDLSASSRNARSARAALAPNSGPLTILIEYQCAPSNASDFLDAIFALGRIRRRDGANTWSVAQDVDDPSLWVERFDIPTWDDYLRGVARGTVADEPLHERARRFRVERPVRRLLKRPPGADPITESDQT